MEKVNLKRKVALVLVFSILLGLFQINPLKVEATESIESIEIVEAPTEFTAGELIDRSKIVVKVNYVTGLSEEISNYNIKYVDKYVPKGLKFLVVEYMGHYSSVRITINDPIEDIGLDSKGNPVDLSLWKYKHVSDKDGPGHYELNNYAEAAYIGEIVDGAIIGNVPSYINGIPVKGMNYAFAGLNDLTVIPEIPETVESMVGTFKNTINITGVFEVSSNLKIIDEIFLGTTQPITVKIKEDSDVSGTNQFGENITVITDKLKSMRVNNLNDFKIGMNLSKENMEIELEYESGYTRKITEKDKLNHLTFQLEGNGVNISRILKVYDIGKTLTLKYQPYTGSGELITEVIIENLDVFGIEISGVNKTPFSAGETVQNNDLSVTDIVFGDNIESFNIVYPTSVLTLDDTYVEVEFQGYKATANINVEEEIIPEPTLGEVLVSYVDTNFAHIKPYDTYYYLTGEEITINAPVIEGYKIATSQGYSSSQVVIPDEFNTQYVNFIYEPDTVSKGTVTVRYKDILTLEILTSETKEYDLETVTIYADNIPIGYRLMSWEDNSKIITVKEGNENIIEFYVEQVKGSVSIEKWLDNSWVYWSDIITLPVGTQTINANDYYSDSSYKLVGDTIKTVEVLDGQTTTVRFDYETPPQGWVNIKLNLEDGSIYQTLNRQMPVGQQTINIYDVWNSNLYEVVGGTEKTVEVSQEQTAIVEFTVRKLAVGYVNKIAKYNGEIIGQQEEELPTGLQNVYAPWVNNLYEASESVKQVEVVEGATVDLVFNYIKNASYFVNHVGKYNEEVLYSTIQEKSLNDTWVNQWDAVQNVPTFNREIYNLQGDSMKQVAPVENETIEVVWNYTKAETGWVKIIGYDESMKVIYEETKEVRLDTDYINAPEIDTGNKDTWYETDEWEKKVIPSLDIITAPTVEFYYTLFSDNGGSGGTEPEVPTDYFNQQTDILLTAEPTIFKAEVPFKIAIHMDSNGIITIGQGYKVVNKSPLGQMVMVEVNITPVNNWVLVDIGEDFKNKTINKKEFGLSMNESVALNGIIPLNTSLSEPIRNGESKDLFFDVKLAGQTVQTNQVISNLTIVLDFWK